MTMQGNTTVTVPQISDEAAAAACAAAVAHARRLGIRINVAVCDGSGTLLAFRRMHGAFLHSVEIAIDKAYTAAGFGMPTRKLFDLIRNDEALRLGLPQRPRLIVFGGGLPICQDGTLVGGIGVSGGSAEEDEACAAAGLAAIGLTYSN